MSLMDIQKKIAREEAKYFRGYMEYAIKIKKIAEKMLKNPDLRVLAFDSVLKAQAIPGKSDIDIPVISSKIPKKLNNKQSYGQKYLKK